MSKIEERRTDSYCDWLSRQSEEDIRKLQADLYEEMRGNLLAQPDLLWLLDRFHAATMFDAFHYMANSVRADQEAKKKKAARRKRAAA